MGLIGPLHTILAIFQGRYSPRTPADILPRGPHGIRNPNQCVVEEACSSRVHGILLRDTVDVQWIPCKYDAVLGIEGSSRRARGGKLSPRLQRAVKEDSPNHDCSFDSRGRVTCEMTDPSFCEVPKT